MDELWAKNRSYYRKYSVKQVHFKRITTVKSFIFVGLKFRGLEFKNEFVDI